MQDPQEVLYLGNLIHVDHVIKYKSSHESELCNTGAYSKPIAAFMSKSTVILQNISLTNNISALIDKLRFCPDGNETDRSHLTYILYPGQRFNVMLVAYGQTNVVMPVRFFLLITTIVIMIIF